MNKKIQKVFLRKWTLLAAVSMFLTTMIPFLTGSSAYAAIPKLDNIRVALYINHPSYQSTIPTVTLVSDLGFDLSLRGSANAADKTLLSLPNNQTIRASLDQYSVSVLETVSFPAAKALYDQLNKLNGQPYIFSRSKQGNTIYQVNYGSYSTKDEASAARDDISRNAAILPLLQSFNPGLTGPYHLNAGNYSTEAEAINGAAILAQAGLTADLAVSQDPSGNSMYSVWLGNESDAQQLNILQAQAASFVPNIALQPIDNTQSYVLRRNDVSLSSSGSDTLLPHYLLSANGQKTLFTPKQTGITVKENSARKYRGSIELSQYNKSLAVINEVPFEEYLYCVVSTEMDSSFVAEALKAQAVTARTYALTMGTKYGIANVTDTVQDQAYYGMQREFAAAIQAVDATKGELLADNNGLITPFYSANAGGITADPSEVWTGQVPYVRSVASPDDVYAAEKLRWYKSVLQNGQIGYVRSDLVQATGRKNAAGLPVYAATEANVNVRPIPSTNNTSSPSFYQLRLGEEVTVIETVAESTSYSWIRTFNATDIQNKLSSTGTALSTPLQTLQVTRKGPSGRAIEVKANGQTVNVKSPDGLRNALGGLPSTLFDIEDAAKYTIVGTGAVTQSVSNASVKVYTLSGQQTGATASQQTTLYAMGADGKTRAISADTQFTFRGNGFGHGLGMSQEGAQGFAKQGYNYVQILQAYYTGVSIVKG